MNIIGIGTDIVKNNRITDKIAHRFLNVDELLIYKSYKSKDQRNEFASSRWAAKEAIIKASNKKYTISNISILTSKSGQPIVKLNNKLDNKILLSISHEKEYSIAYCVILK